MTSFLHLGRNDEARRNMSAAEALGWPREQAPVPDCGFLLAARRGCMAEAVEYGRAGLNAAMRAANAEAALDAMGAALCNPAARPAAIAALMDLVAQVDVAGLGPLNQKRMLIWLVMLGAVDEAFDLLQAVLRQSDTGAIGGPWGWLWLAEMRPLRRAPRFQRLVAQFGFADYWRLHGPPDGHVFSHGMLREA
jgi:hypothetical protein